jgi:hypothetical protein
MGLRHREEPKRPPPPASLRPYPKVLTIASENDWDVELSITKYGWVLALRDGDQLVTKARSRKKPPACFIELGSITAEALLKQGRLS